MKPALLSKWFNAIADAYNRGEFPGAYLDGTSEVVRVYNKVFREHDSDAADEAVVAWATANGVSLKRRHS